MHAATLGRELGVRKIIVPLYPGYFSAWGMLVTEPRRDFIQTALSRTDSMDNAALTAILEARLFKLDLLAAGALPSLLTGSASST